MKGIVVCFTGFKDSRKDLVSFETFRRFEIGLPLLICILIKGRLVCYVHHMGGSVRKDLTNTTTHLVARSSAGGKYRVSKRAER